MFCVSLARAFVVCVCVCVCVFGLSVSSTYRQSMEVFAYHEVLRKWVEVGNR
jgi:cation transport ATPase